MCSGYFFKLIEIILTFDFTVVISLLKKLLTSMYVLVRFTADDIYYVCNSNKIKTSGFRTLAKWMNHRYYEAKVITTSNEENVLQSLCNNLTSGYPLVELEKISESNSNIQSQGDSCMEETIIISNGGNDNASITKDFEYDDSSEDPFFTDEDSSYCPSLDEDDYMEQSELARNDCRQLIENRFECDDTNRSASSLGVAPLDTFSMENVGMQIESATELCMFCGQLVVDLQRHLRKSHKGKDMDVLIFSDENQASEGKIKSTKLHNCIYCGTAHTKLARHLERRHKDVDEVKRIMALTKGSLERRQAFAEIQKKGDFEHNKINPSEAITIRRCVNNRNISFVPCPYCKGYYSKINLRNHVRLYCNSYDQSGTKKLQVKSREVLPMIHPEACDILKYEIFPKMNNDIVTRAIAYDETVVSFANMLVTKYGMSSHHHKMIRNRIRHISRIFLHIKKINPSIKDVKSIFDPAHFDDLVKAIHNLAGLSCGKYKAPSTASQSCTLVVHVAKFIQCTSIKNKDDDLRKLIQNFIFLMEHSQNAMITKVAGENRTQHQRSKLDVLPQTNEVNKLFDLLRLEIDKSLNDLESGFNINSWITLSKLTLVQIMIFNRKRPGDVEKSQIIEYENLQSVDNENMSKLSESEKKYASTFGRYITRGKLNKPAPTLVSKTNMDAIKIILKYRKDAKVADDNIYIFGTPEGSRCPYFKADLALKKFCHQMKLPASTLNATKLRKHLATTTSTLAKGEQLVISDFMGHAFEIHNNIYKQRLALTDIVKMGKVLTEAVGGINSDSILSPSLSNPAQITIPSMPPEPTLSYVTTTELSRQNDGSMRIVDVESAGPSRENKNSMEHENHCEDLSPIIEETNESPRFQHKSRIRLFRTSPLFKTKRTWRTPERQTIRRCLGWYLKKKVVPSLLECQDIIFENPSVSKRSPQQLRSWIIAEIKRNDKRTKKGGWSTPIKEKCRQYFKHYYETKSYPPSGELLHAIDTVPEFTGKTKEVLRSHLQHDYKYLEGLD